MSNKKPQLTEGLLSSIIDNFFKSLHKGIADRYIKAAEKAGVHPDIAKKLKDIDDSYQDLKDYMKKYGTK